MAFQCDFYEFFWFPFNLNFYSVWRATGYFPWIIVGVLFSMITLKYWRYFSEISIKYLGRFPSARLSFFERVAGYFYRICVGFWWYFYGIYLRFLWNLLWDFHQQDCYSVGSVAGDFPDPWLTLCVKKDTAGAISAQFFHQDRDDDGDDAAILRMMIMVVVVLLYTI